MRNFIDRDRKHLPFTNQIPAIRMNRRWTVLWVCWGLVWAYLYLGPLYESGWHFWRWLVLAMPVVFSAHASYQWAAATYKEINRRTFLTASGCCPGCLEPLENNEDWCEMILDVTATAEGRIVSHYLVCPSCWNRHVHELEAEA